jgi:hypothetical protein
MDPASRSRQAGEQGKQLDRSCIDGGFARILHAKQVSDFSWNRLITTTAALSIAKNSVTLFLIVKNQIRNLLTSIQCAFAFRSLRFFSLLSGMRLLNRKII